MDVSEPAHAACPAENDTGVDDAVRIARDHDAERLTGPAEALFCSGQQRGRNGIGFGTG